jgi:hypothetical protein
MNLLTRIRDAFGFAPKLANKAGGMALIRVGDSNWCQLGASAINGYVVKTKSHLGGHWMLEPKPEFRVTHPFRYNGLQYQIGDLAVVTGMDDKHLEPLPETGVSDKEVAELYAPGPCPILTKVEAA